MTIRLGITGRFRRGKDTVANFVSSALGGEGISQIAFADALKDDHAKMTRDELALRKLLPKSIADWPDFRKWMREHRNENGVGWQWYGEFMRAMGGEDYWIKHPRLNYVFSNAVTLNHHIIITDMRYHNEAEWLRERGFYLVRVIGPNRSTSDVRDVDHPSERYIEELEVHYEVYNTGTLEWLESLVRNRLIPKAIDYCADFDAAADAEPAATFTEVKV